MLPAWGTSTEATASHAGWDGDDEGDIRAAYTEDEKKENIPPISLTSVSTNGAYPGQKRRLVIILDEKKKEFIKAYSGEVSLSAH